MTKKTQKNLSKHEADLAKSPIDNRTDFIKVEDTVKNNTKKIADVNKKNSSGKLTAKKNSEIACSENVEEIDDGGWLCL